MKHLKFLKEKPQPNVLYSVDIVFKKEGEIDIFRQQKSHKNLLLAHLCYEDIVGRKMPRNENPDFHREAPEKGKFGET